MTFLRMGNAKVIARDYMRIEIRYLANGKMDSRVLCKEGNKWRPVTTAWSQDAPTWDLLHKCHYIGRGDKMFNPPNPIEGVIAHMKYTAHCMDVFAYRRKKK